MLELVLPKNYVKLLAGVVSMVFEQFNGKVSAASAKMVKAEPDDLTRINGIGPTFAKRLQEAGIDSFEKLAAASPLVVKEVAKLAAWQAGPAGWVGEEETVGQRPRFEPGTQNGRSLRNGRFHFKVPR